MVHRAGKLGLGTATMAAMRYAIEDQYDFLVNMDADFSHHPRYLPALLAATEDADLVIGSRYVPGGRTPDWGLSRRLISGFGNVFARTLLRLPVRDCTAGFKCYRRCVLEAFALDAIRLEGYAFQIETVYQSVRKGFRIKEVPIVFPDRKVGRAPRAAVLPEARALRDEVAQRFAVVLLPTAPPRPAAGAELYRVACQSCHGEGGHLPAHLAELSIIVHRS